MPPRRDKARMSWTALSMAFLHIERSMNTPNHCGSGVRRQWPGGGALVIEVLICRQVTLDLTNRS